jgi:hypothetical protein
MINFYRNKLSLIILLLIILFTNSCYTQFHTVKSEVNSESHIKKSHYSNIDSLEVELRFYLYEKYHHGNCYGMPGPTDKRIMRNVIAKNPALVEITKSKYYVSREPYIYKILVSVLSFHLEEIDNGYRFSFTDGDCCTITRCEGFLYMLDA